MYNKENENNTPTNDSLLKPWQEDFCVEMAKGVTTQIKAYRIARRTPDTTKDNTLGKKASALLKRPEIKQRIKEIRSEAAVYDLLNMFNDVDEALRNELKRPNEGFSARSNFAVAKLIEMKAKAAGLFEKDNIRQIQGSIDHKGIPKAFNIVIDSGQVKSEGENESE